MRVLAHCGLNSGALIRKYDFLLPVAAKGHSGLIATQNISIKKCVLLLMFNGLLVNTGCRIILNPFVLINLILDSDWSKAVDSFSITAAFQKE